MHYVYEWVRSDLNLPYYIGAGKGNRAHQLKRNKHTNYVTNYLLDNGIRREVRIIAYFSTDKAAKQFEVERIAYYWYLKDHDILTNQTLGGDGVSGDVNKGDNNCMRNPKIAAANAAARRGIPNDNVKGSKNGMYGRRGELSPAFGRTNGEKQREAARKTGLKNKGENNPNYGKTPNEETKEKLSASNRGQKRSEETKLKMRKPRSPEGKAAIAASNRARAERKRSEKAARLLNGDK